VSLDGDVIVVVVPEGAAVLCALQIVREHAAKVREWLRSEADFYERELASES